ncbi:DUF5685 family protein [Mariniblastus sp.]|nr:DUF5685 family protein [Mariniblastus sp.]
MFGYLKLSSRSNCNSKKRYRQIYASLCSWQRQTFGVRASILISYEAVFLYQLAVDAGLVDPPAECTPTCCKLRNDWPNHWNVNPEAAEFTNAFAILLARIKIEDDIRDSGKWLARGGNWFWAKAFRQSNEYFSNFDTRLIPEIDRLVDNHLSLENQRFSGSPEEYAAPTANAFGEIFKSFASHVLKESADKVELFYGVGQAIGAGILLSDCMFDFQRDLRRGEFNPIQNKHPLGKYQQAGLKAFSRAGWDCEQLADCQQSPIASQILRFGFDRVDRFSLNLETKPVESKFRAPRRLHQWSSLRTGDCDCGGCDACGAGCEGGGCDGCDGGGCCDGGAPDGGSIADSPPMCLSGFFCCEPCFDPGCDSKKNKPQMQPSVESLKPDSIMDADLENKVGFADCPLNPTGYILVDGQRYPAKTNGQFCDTGQKVRVLAKSSFGFIVEPMED